MLRGCYHVTNFFEIPSLQSTGSLQSCVSHMLDFFLLFSSEEHFNYRFWAISTNEAKKFSVYPSFEGSQTMTNVLSFHVAVTFTFASHELTTTGSVFQHPLLKFTSVFQSAWVENDLLYWRWKLSWRITCRGDIWLPASGCPSAPIQLRSSLKRAPQSSEPKQRLRYPTPAAQYAS